ncbi:MAG: hypothetical protein ACFFD6_11895, partial [Candidatus Thorarchaeota archaeon]
DFNWFVDNIPDSSVDGDCFAVRFRFTRGFQDEKLIWYYFSGSTSMSNTSSRMYYMIGGNGQTWNSFSRNVTKDYVVNFGNIEGDRTLYNLGFHVVHRGSTSELARAFIDDVHLVNGTTTYISGPTKNGDFESTVSTANWIAYGGNSDAADISQSAESYSGDWSLNATVSSNGNRSDCSVNTYLSTRLTSLNRDEFQLSYKIDAADSLSGDTYAYLYLEGGNDTHEMGFFFVFAAGQLPSYIENTTQYYVSFVDGFNTTTGWMHIDSSLWEIAADYFNVSDSSVFEMEIFNLEFEFRASSPGSRITILLDNFRVVSAVLNDMGYEDQPDVGRKVIAWGSDIYSETSSLFTVTGEAYEGEKAANMTLGSGDYFEKSQDPEAMTIAGDKEAYLDLMWKCNNFYSEGYSRVTLTVIYWDEKEVVYYFMYNETTLGTNSTYDAHYIVDSANTIGSWEWAHRDLYHDYVEAFGALDETQISSFRLEGDADSGDGLTFLIDNLYFYTDLAPEITDVTQIPLSPDVDEEVMVFADVVDAWLDNVTLHYRVDGGTWSSHPMVYVSGLGHRGVIPGQSADTTIDYYIVAMDVYGKSDTSETFSYDVLGPTSTTTSTTTTEPPPPLDILPVAIILAVAVAAIVFISFAVIRPRQSR